MSTPQLQLETGFVLDRAGRIVATREPGATRGPRFMLIRGAGEVAWALRSDVSPSVAAKIAPLVAEERPVADLRAAPLHAAAYRALLGGVVTAGPALTFPDVIAPVTDVAEVHEEQALAHRFSGWVPGEIAAGRAPVMAMLDGGVPVSVCFCARRSAVAAEAGVETAASHRGRGYAPRVVAAWAGAVRAEELVPIYSTSWDNHASLAVARKLALVPFASSWGLGDGSDDAPVSPGPG